MGDSDYYRPSQQQQPQPLSYPGHNSTRKKRSSSSTEPSGGGGGGAERNGPPRNRSDDDHCMNHSTEKRYRRG
jgi:hypothetical protein